MFGLRIATIPDAGHTQDWLWQRTGVRFDRSEFVNTRAELVERLHFYGVDSQGESYHAYGRSYHGKVMVEGLMRRCNIYLCDEYGAALQQTNEQAEMLMREVLAHG